VNPRRCRFCEREDGTVTFRHDAHVIPAALGNTTVFSRGECDGCNQEFGETIESDFVNFLGPYRTISGIRARAGIPTFRRRPSSAPIRNDGQGTVLMNESDDTVTVRHGNDGSSLEVNIEYPPFDLENVGRTLARMALFYLPSSSASPFRHLLEWVRGTVSWRPSIYEVLLGGGVSKNGVFMILEPPPGHTDRGHSLLVCLVCSSIAHFLPFPRADWTVAEPQWEDVLRPFSVFGDSFQIQRFHAIRSGRITGFRRTLHLR
jgi:hypothetical protein